MYIYICRICDLFGSDFYLANFVTSLNLKIMLTNFIAIMSATLPS